MKGNKKRGLASHSLSQPQSAMDDASLFLVLGGSLSFRFSLTCRQSYSNGWSADLLPHTAGPDGLIPFERSRLCWRPIVEMSEGDRGSIGKREESEVRHGRFCVLLRRPGGRETRVGNFSVDMAPRRALCEVKVARREDSRKLRQISCRTGHLATFVVSLREAFAEGRRFVVVVVLSLRGVYGNTIETLFACPYLLQGRGPNPRPALFSQHTRGRTPCLAHVVSGIRSYTRLCGAQKKQGISSQRRAWLACFFYSSSIPGRILLFVRNLPSAIKSPVPC